MINLILVRHGQSQWNLENRFTGWVDVPLTPVGEEEAKKAGHLLKKQGYHIDRCFVSPLTRAKQTARLLLDAMDSGVQTIETPEMIERFYGALTGLNKTETSDRFGEEQVHIWRRSYDIAPPPLEEHDSRHPKHNTDFTAFPFALPATESLKDVVERVVPFWDNILKPLMQPNTTTLIVAHGNSIRALIKEIKGLDDVAIASVEIPTATPCIMTFSDAGVYQDDRMAA
jgi:2,3-bisphosphoglycerate-dependent phosphoglycerate mutase